MKRFKLFIAGLAALALLALVPMLPVFAETNLIANPSAEKASRSKPLNWTSNQWGSNLASFKYAKTGKDGSRSLRIDMQSYQDGDAKWMADPVNVKGNQLYTYTSFYRANVETEITVQYTHADGSVTYEFVQIIPVASKWQQLTAEFVTPATATKAVVLHVINQVGVLQTDMFSLTSKDTPPPVDEENLLANSSFEAATGTTPTDWNTSSWGDVTAQFTHENSGYTGSRSATVAVTKHTSGDAKWYAKPVNVLAGKAYLYRDYYKSTSDSRVVAAFIDAAGNWSFADLEKAPASGDWRQYQSTFAVPAGTVQMTIFHLIDGVGTLTIDDALLQVSVPVGDNPAVPNASLENASSAAQPTGWLHNSWGNNTAQFDYVNEGRTGSKSVKTTISNYQDGDAKWYFEPIKTLKADKQYRFSVWYKGNIVPQVVAMYLKADGSAAYLGMPQPAVPTTNQWQQYTNTFTVPSDAVAVSTFMYVKQNGWLQTDDYSITEYHPQGFSRPLLTLTFDDGHEDNVNTALPLLKQYGFKTTQCYATTFIEGNSQAVADVRKFQNSGHEICSHTVTHPFLTSLDAAKLKYELQHSRQYLESITGVPVDNFATPYGDYNMSVNEAIKGYYGSHRTVDEGFNSKDNFDKYRLRVQNILDTTTPEQVTEWIKQAQLDNTWLILVYHRVASDPGPYDTYTDVFAKQLEAIKQSGITVKTYDAALDEVMSQL